MGSNKPYIFVSLKNTRFYCWIDWNTHKVRQMKLSTDLLYFHGVQDLIISFISLKFSALRG